MTFDVSQDFVALDSELLEPQNVDQCQPVDVFALRAIRRNVVELVRRGSKITWWSESGDAGDLTAKAGVRPYQSLDWSSVFGHPYWANRRLKKLRFKMLYRCGHEGADAGAQADIRMTLEGLGEAYTGVSYTAGDPQPWQVHEWEMVLRRPVALGIESTLRLEVRVSTETADVVDTTVGVTPAALCQLQEVDVAGTFYADSAVSQPGANDLGVMVTQGAAGPVQVYYDHFLRQSDRNMIVRGPQGRLAQLDVTNTVYLPYLQIKSLEIEEVYELEEAEVPIDVYRAQRTVDGREDVRLPELVDEVARRMRPLWMGTRGRRGLEEPVWPAGYNRRFPVISSNGVTAADVLVAPVRPSRAGCKLRLALDIIGIHEVLGYSASSLEDIFEHRTEIGWTFDLEVRGFIDGAGDVPYSSTDHEVTVAHYPYDFAGESSILLMSLGNQGYWYREGQLYPEDQPFVQRIWIEAPAVGSYEPDSTPPLYLRVRALVDSTFPDDPGVPGADQVNALNFYVVGATAWEVAP